MPAAENPQGLGFRLSRSEALKFLSIHAASPPVLDATRASRAKQANLRFECQFLDLRLKPEDLR